MSKYSKQNRLDEKALAVISNFFSDQYGDYFDLQFHGIKDNTPDTDGFLRLRKPTKDKEMDGEYLNKVVFFQLKGQAKPIENQSYSCKTTLVDFCMEINIPIILFVVGGLEKTPEIYWYYFSNTNNKLLKGLKKNLSQKIITIPNLELLKGAEINRWKVFYDFIDGLAKKDSFKDLPEPALEILNIYKDNLNKVAGSVYLLGTLDKNGINILVDILSIKKQDINKILKLLGNKELVYFKNNLIFFKNIKDKRNIYIGSLFLTEILDEVDIQQMLYFFPKKKENILISISTIYHPIIKGILENYAKSQFINNDDILEKLELLKVYIFRISDKGILIIKDINKTLGKDVGVRLKLIEVLEVLRYIKTQEVFTLLLQLSNSGDDIIQENVQKVLSKIVKYDLFALKKIGFRPQTTLLDQIDKFSNRKLSKNHEAIRTILIEILNPSYDSHIRKNSKTIEIYQGALQSSKELESIRFRAITILQRLFELSATNIQKIGIIDTLSKATELPYDTYTEELKELIINNTNDIIAYYITLIDNSDNEIIQAIDEQIYHLKRRFKEEFLTNIQELESIIAQKKEYSIYNILTGKDYYSDENLDWKDAERQREQKIKELIEDINEDNFNTWEERIASILDLYEKGKNDPSKYYYFRFLLKELGQYKPEIAKKLIDNNEQKLGDFLSDIISGIWLSTNRSTAITLITNFIEQGKHLSICIYIFAEVKEINVDLLQMGFKKAKEKGDVKALINIIRSIGVNYPKDNSHTKLFIEAVKSLTKLKSSTWVNYVRYQDKLFWEQFTEKQFNVILKNLELAPDIDYPVEAILEIIFNKYPSKIVPFLKSRINKRSVNSDFKAIPYKFYKLLSVFRDNKQQIIPEILKWFNNKNVIFGYEGRKILTNTYTLDILDQFLVELLDTEQKQNIKTVWVILGGYIGKITLDIRIVQKLIREYPDIHNDLMYFMSNTDDVVVGEYGFVNDLISKKEDIQKWKKDKRKYIQNFVKQYEEYLDKQIDYEKKKANEDIILMENNKY